MTNNAQAEMVGRLRAYRPTDEWGDGVHHVICTEAAAEIERMAGEVERLRAALKPFADATMHLHPSHPDDGETLDGFKVSDFRRAQRALGGGE